MKSFVSEDRFLRPKSVNVNRQSVSRWLFDVCGAAIDKPFLTRLDAPRERRARSLSVSAERALKGIEEAQA